MVDIFRRELNLGNLVVYSRYCKIDRGVQQIPTYALITDEDKIFTKKGIKNSKGATVLLIDTPTKEEILIHEDLIERWRATITSNTDYVIGSVFMGGYAEQEMFIYLGSPVIYFCDELGNMTEVSRVKRLPHTFLDLMYVKDRASVIKALTELSKDTPNSFFTGIRKKRKYQSAKGWMTRFCRKQDFNYFCEMLGVLDFVSYIKDGKLTIDLSYTKKGNVLNNCCLILDYTEGIK